MLLVLSMVIRLIFIFAPLYTLIILIVKKQMKILSIFLVLGLLINSYFMLFANIKQQNILEMNSLDIDNIIDYYSSKEFTENRESYIYIDSKYEESKFTAVFKDIVYKKYSINEDFDSTINMIKSESPFLRQTPQFNEVNGIYYFCSDLESKVNLWNLLYNDTLYKGCFIIADDDFVYYVEYDVQLNYEQTPFLSTLEQIFYKMKFKSEVDVMNFFVD